MSYSGNRVICTVMSRYNKIYIFDIVGKGLQSILHRLYPHCIHILIGSRLAARLYTGALLYPLGSEPVNRCEILIGNSL